MHWDGESIGREARLRPGQDTCLLQDPHPIHSHLKTGKIHAYMEGIWKLNIEPRTVTIASLSLSGSIISQNCVVHKEWKKG